MKGTIVPIGPDLFAVETRDRLSDEPVLVVRKWRITKWRGKVEAWQAVASEIGDASWTGAKGLEVWTDDEAEIEEITITMPTRGNWAWRDGGWKRG